MLFERICHSGKTSLYLSVRCLYPELLKPLEDLSIVTVFSKNVSRPCFFTGCRLSSFSNNYRLHRRPKTLNNFCKDKKKRLSTLNGSLITDQKYYKN